MTWAPDRARLTLACITEARHSDALKFLTLRVHLLMAALLVASLLHPLGRYAKPQTLQFFVGRVGGMTITISVMIASAVLILWRLLLGG
jgi:uncharacterized membrane protein YecN with MAPEG domain